ncbi:MAG: protein kinase domain-containing protein [Pirellulaceae bacterium]
MTSPPRHLESSTPECLVREVIDRWRGGDSPDAAGFLSANPVVRERKSLAMDLIYEEYCLRNEAGETLVPSTFCRKFPTYRQSLQRLIDVHQFLDGHPEDPKEKPWKWPEAGESVLGFKIIQKLGEGAIAKVYLAHQPELGQRRVVVKISRHGATEARLLGKLEHPSIVPVHSVHQDAASGLTCICMPFLGTATLVDLLDLAYSKGQPPQTAEILLSVARQYQPVGSREADEPDADPILRRGTYVEGILQLGVQLAEALATAHAAGVLHRDIKPSNVLLSRSGRPMLLDFNLSSDLEMPLERVGGTVAYMAPERIRCLLADDVHSESKLDPRGDVYSLGALLYELLCGELPSRPPTAPGKQARLEEWLKGRLTLPPSPAARNPEVDRHVERAVLKALSPDPADRFPSAAEFAKALGEALAWKARAARWLRRNRRAALASAAGILAVVALSAAVWASGEPYDARMFRVGEQAYSQGDSQTAIEYFSRILEVKPNDAAALFARGQAHRQAKDFVLAQRDYQNAFDQSGDGQLLYYVGFCHLKSGYFVQAQVNLEKSVANNFSSPQLLHNLAYCFFKTNRRDETAALLEKMLASQPAGLLPLSHHLCARAQLISARSDSRPLPTTTLGHLQNALAGTPNDPLLGLDAACIYVYQSTHEPASREKYREAALEYLRQAVSSGASQLAVNAEGPFLGGLTDKLTPEEHKLLQGREQKPLSTPLYYEPSLSLHLQTGSRGSSLVARP